MSRPRSHGRVYARRRGATKNLVTWWIEYWGTENGEEKQFRESAGSSKRQVANDLLKKRLGEIGAGTFVAPEARRVTLDDMAKMLLDDYTNNGRRSSARAVQALAHLRRYFGSDPVAKITRASVDAYIAARLREGAARATVNLETAALRRMFRLAIRAGGLSAMPHIQRMVLQNTRPTAFTDAELDAVLDVLANGRPATAKDPEVKPRPDLVPPIVFASVTGWRMFSEVLPLEWSAVDFKAGTVSLAIHTTKSGKARVFPFGVVPKLAALLREQREATTALERATATIIPHVFHHYGGREIKDLYASWRAACRRAGVPGRVPHDLRRTAARALRALGMSDRDIAEACGWDTIDMVTRYLGRDPSGLAERLRVRIAESGAGFRTVSVPKHTPEAKRRRPHTL